MNRIRLLSIALGALAVLGGASAVAQSPLHGRISYDAGHSMVKGLNDEAWSHAAINTMILPGDNLWADQGGTSELEFSGGTFARLADGSKLEVASLSPGVQLRAWEGAFYLHRVNRSTGTLVVETPEAFVDIEADSNVRIDVVREGGTTVSTRWGRATVRGRAGGSAIVGEGMRVWVDPGLLPSTPTPYDRAAEDAFDAWNRERTKFLAVGDDVAPAAVGITEPVLGTSDLARYGEWVQVDSRRYWRPTVVVDYVPYRYGYWSTVPAVGNVWVGQYPFCYVTSHYGRWTHHPRHGWIWGYYPGWSPAWAATLRVGDYYVWSPVDYYNRPVVVSSASVFSIGGVGFSIYATSYVPVTRIGYGWGYVSPFNTGLVHYVDTRPTQINIWNININTNRHHVRVPYQRDFNTVRNYNPPRAIRGPDAFPGRGVQVGNRAAELESRLGRSQFTVDRGVRGGGAQTRAHSGAGENRVRQVSLSEERPSFTRATRGAPVSASQDREAIRQRAGVRDNDAIPTISGRGEGRGVRDGAAPGRPAATGRDASVRSQGNEGRGEVSRTRTEAPSDRGAAPARGLTGRPAETVDRANVDRGAVRQTPATPSRGQVEAPGRATRGTADPGTAARTPDRTAPPRGEAAPSRREPAVGRTDQAPARAAVPNRESAVRQPQVTERSRGDGNVGVQRRVVPNTTAAPRASAPERSQRVAPTAPRREAQSPPQRVAPTAPQRQAPPQQVAPIAPQRQAPPQQIAPRQQPAPRQQALPRQHIAPGQQSAPSPQAAPRQAPSFRAPQAAPRGADVQRAPSGSVRQQAGSQRGR